MDKDKNKISNLQEDWRKLDNLTDDSKLSPSVIHQQIEHFVLEKKKRLLKELAYFLLTAVVLLATAFYILFQSVLFFMIVQGVIFTVGPIIGFLLFKKEKEERAS
ncbi:hypothetical protein BTS2_2342 [Bacillus sp. TS-2]|nr:hypothetical protein BTS2_2342 [Bacillus sp. TS-2]